MVNPDVKKGDQIILKKSRNGLYNLEGQVLEVRSVASNKQSMSVGVIKDGKCLSTGTVYCDRNGGPADDFCLASRKDQARWLRGNIEELKDKLKKLEAEADYLEKYDTDEEAVAAKLVDLFSKKDDPKAMAEILRTLKKTDYI